MNTITDVIVDKVTDLEHIVKDWCWCLEVDDGFIEKYTCEDDGSVKGLFRKTEWDVIPFDELVKDVSQKYKSIEYLGNGRYYCEEYRKWEDLTTEEKKSVLIETIDNTSYLDLVGEIKTFEM